MIVRPRDCARLLGVSLSTLWRYAKAPDFPVAFRLGPNAVGYSEEEVREWLERRRQTRKAVGGSET